VRHTTLVIWCLVCWFALGCWGSAFVVAQFEALPESLSPELQIEEVNQAALSQLQRAEKFLQEKLWADALDTLQHTLDTDGERLVVSEGKNEAHRFVTFIPVREACRRKLSAWCREHEALLQLYRQQWDAEAAALLADAKRTHQTAPLHQLIRRYFAATAAEEALLLAGDAAFSRGEFNAARADWEPLLPNYRVSSSAAEQLKIKTGLPWYDAWRGESLETRWAEVEPCLKAAQPHARGAYVEVKIAPAEIAMRMILASLMAGERRRAEWEFALFQRLYSTAEGRLGNKRGLLVKLLAERFAEQPPPVLNTPDWPTFAGNFERSGLAQGKLEIAGQPRWSAPLRKLSSDRDLIGQGKLRVAEDHRGLLSYHPVLVKDKVIVAEERTVRAYQLTSGKLQWEVPVAENPPAEVLTERQVGVPRYTLSAGEGVFALVVAAPAVPARRAPTVRRDALSRLLAIEQGSNKLIFEAVVDDATWAFEGVPVIHRGKLYVMQRQLSDVRSRVFVVCYDIASGQKVWERFVAAAEPLGQGNSVTYANGTLSLTEHTLFCNTNLGAIAALRVDDGSLQWLTRYPRAAFPSPRPDRSDRHFFRDLTPCLPHGTQLFCAPSDSERIFSLDSITGDLQWSLPPGSAADAIHLLGVADAYLLASGDALYWIDRVSGAIVTQFPQANPVGMGNAIASPRGWGRGLIVGQNVYWPTENSIYMFATQPQRKESFYEPQGVAEIDLRSRKLTGGNLIYAQGSLLMSTADAMVLFGAESPSRDAQGARAE
jgi:outer membrane protein assembly factor BamB